MSNARVAVQRIKIRVRFMVSFLLFHVFLFLMLNFNGSSNTRYMFENLEYVRYVMLG